MRQLRSARKRTQVEVAEILGVGQDSVSRLENRSDLLVSSLRDYVEAVGGHLTLVAEFPDRGPVILLKAQRSKERPGPTHRRQTSRLQ